MILVKSFFPILVMAGFFVGVVYLVKYVVHRVKASGR